MTILQDKLLTRIYCDQAGDNAVPNVLSPKDLVVRPDRNWTIINCEKALQFVHKGRVIEAIISYISTIILL